MIFDCICYKYFTKALIFLSRLLNDIQSQYEFCYNLHSLTFFVFFIMNSLGNQCERAGNNKESLADGWENQLTAGKTAPGVGG